MGFFTRERQITKANLRFASTAVLERDLDGSDERFAEYFFAIYHCLPTEGEAGIVIRREQLREQFPDKATPVGSYFVLVGEPACQALHAYYQGMAAQHETEDMREYFASRLSELEKTHNRSQSLPVPVDLTEGQLSRDLQLERLTLLALWNGQVVIQP